jgi:hypothetical protein
LQESSGPQKIYKYEWCFGDKGTIRTIMTIVQFPEQPIWIGQVIGYAFMSIGVLIILSLTWRMIKLLRMSINRPIINYRFEGLSRNSKPLIGKYYGDSLIDVKECD